MLDRSVVQRLRKNSPLRVGLGQSVRLSALMVVSRSILWVVSLLIMYRSVQRWFALPGL